MVFGALYRVYKGWISPPQATKKDDAIRFGLLGASNIAPISLIAPAKAHPEVIVAAVAARDRSRAEAYAKKYGIPIVHTSYQDLLDDPSIDAIYIAQPNSLHFEWALRSLRAGKHVLLEKPSCSNSAEARALFNHPLVKAPNAPILLEAFHYRFHPAWQAFLAQIHGHGLGRVESAHAQQFLPKWAIPADDIRWRFDLAGGAMMDFGTYPLSCLRQILREEPRVITAEPTISEYEDRADQAMRATYTTESGAKGEMLADLAAAGGWPLLPASWTKGLPSFGWPKCEVELAEREGDGDGGSFKRKVTIWNYLMPSVYHRIDVEDTHTLRRGGQIVKTWKDSKNIKAYTWPSGDGEEWWSSYNYQLHEFVNKVKGRSGSGVWVDGEDSIRQMEAIDRTYEKAGMEIRPSSNFEL
ncbi:hypothetical protein ASPWEDRAFT_59191 [Aspergillus wentii DTO 134E9]|uniref:D-xylose 1-dehydrogenase (NADP(+), D-xylono-1,5-lactone-forming) n=1 Tax=Aspergillus wentii DTO 134E9 TaxID=1073089 RepID=A0A1L9RSJ7_ASPWE|nr:uncharacterized protein ASPWEDRAFT_59191 [Aspergillus wentii DTO 134E9]KAI9930655.1 hypothetical protein MW887_011410 [Aspergillus wentii]OJJ37818.1 hypothetical protein ASPWEDRAFT_59191 [Aspergillus wentii DTO 134E9]